MEYLTRKRGFTWTTAVQISLKYEFISADTFQPESTHWEMHLSQHKIFRINLSLGYLKHSDCLFIIVQPIVVLKTA